MVAGLRWIWCAVAIGALMGCGGGARESDGGAGTAGGGGGGVGAGGSGDGAGGSGGGAGGRSSCTIATRPIDPRDLTGTAVCNTLAFGAGWVSAQALGGVDGGEPAAAAGGTIVDGDYDLVSLRSSTFTMRTRRSIRIFDQATYVQWLMDNEGSTSDPGDGGVITSYRFDTTSQVSGTDLAMVTLTCGNNSFSSRFGYTAAGDDLLLYSYEGGGGGPLQHIFTYRRTCTR